MFNREEADDYEDSGDDELFEYCRCPYIPPPFFRLGVIADWTMVPTAAVAVTTTTSPNGNKSNEVDHQNHEQQQDNNKNKKTNSKKNKNNGMTVTPGVGAAWIQCWTPITLTLMADHNKGRHVDSNHAELTMAVLPEYRGRGIGKRMLQDVIEYANESSVKAITLSVPADDVRAQGFYRQFGFEQAKESCDGEGKDTLTMIRTL